MKITRAMLALQSTITENEEAAAGGCPQARAVCAEAEEELDALLRKALRPRRSLADEQFEADMLDLAGTADPYAPARSSNYD